MQDPRRDRRAGQVVTNFLNFAKPAELTLTPIDMRAVADRAADEVRGDARAAVRRRRRRRLRDR